MDKDKKPTLSWSSPSQTSKPAAPQLKTLLPAGPGKDAAVRSGGSAALYTSLFVGGVIIGVLLAWSWSSWHTGGSPSQAASTTQESQTTKAGDNSTADAATAQDELTVPSPQAAGQSVTVAQAQIGSPTWVVVYEDRDGKPGNVLGAQLFFTSGSGTVTLLRPTMAGQTYWVGKSTDNGDRKYQKTDDKPEVNTDGSIWAVSFKAN